MHTASLMKLPCYLLKLSIRNKNMGVSRADSFVKIWRNLPFSNHKPDLLNVNAYSKFGENPLLFTQIIARKRKYGRKHWCLLKLSSGNKKKGVSRATVKNWRNLAISNPKPDLHNMNAHTKFGENPLMFTQVIIRKQKRMEGRIYDGQTDGRTHGRPTWNHNTPPLLCGRV